MQRSRYNRPAGNRSGVDPIQRQVVLPFKNSVQIALMSIRVRFLRSLITTMSLVLAVAFFSFVSVGTDVANGLLSTGDPGVRQALVRSGYDLADEDTQVGSSPKQRWILILSLLVCVVGIVNAQLMAVTERFREIGTMKCLGALDRFILKLFVLEATLQGLVGAVIGAVAGSCFAVFGGMLRFGLAALRSLPWDAVAGSLLLAVLVGVGLSLIGVLYPAWVAARMHPAEAMRAEH